MFAQATYSDIYGNSNAFLPNIIGETPRSILVTGCRGMLGNGIMETLLRMQEVGFLNESKLFFASRAWPESVQRESVQKQNSRKIQNNEIIEEIQNAELVIHTASPSNITKFQHYSELHESNTGLLKTISSLEAKRVVYLSSGEVYAGKRIPEGTHSLDFQIDSKRDWYPLAKLEAEAELEKYAQETGATTISIRLFHTYGPGLKQDDGRSFADFLWGGVIQNRIELNSLGNQVRSFLYLSDAISAILKISLNNFREPRIINLGSSAPTTIKDFAEAVSVATGADLFVRKDPSFLHSPNVEMLPTLEAIKCINWNASVDLQEGIKRTVNWIAKQNSVN